MRATPGNYPHKPMPDRRARIDLQRAYDQTEYEALLQGNIPRAPGDRWFAYEEDDWVSLHLSSTGTCIYRLRLEKAGKQWRVAEAWANRDPDQYDSTDDRADATMLSHLLDRIITGNGN